MNVWSLTATHIHVLLMTQIFGYRWMAGWPAILHPFQQYLSNIWTMRGRWWKAVCSRTLFTIKKITASSGAWSQDLMISRPALNPLNYQDVYGCWGSWIHLAFSLGSPSMKRDGWMICGFTPFSTVQQSYRDHGRVIMRSWIVWNLVYGWNNFCFKQELNPEPPDHMSST